MSSLIYDDDWLADILKSVKTVAMVGASAKWNRPSNFVMKYLQGKGYRVIPVNPGLAGGEILGETVYGSLSDIPDDFQMVDIFRNSEAAGKITEEVLGLVGDKDIQVIWMQLTVINEEAAQKAEEKGLKVVMDRCPKIEYGRLFGELSWSGINSGIISSKRLKR
ncbi:CoA-binding protein [Terasakiella sp. A23]|uniref:CoA-binding protein n=1 Tax=Terasakiella sp. FCG-A23 TaxID=3080561 RepID=UPI002955260B|nr:CoA-binding protein [Terasakiella sp. A23]MDV7340425.1 CoA-binding protein [Terasakiella sp. A23]